MRLLDISPVERLELTVRSAVEEDRFEAYAGAYIASSSLPVERTRNHVALWLGVKGNMERIRREVAGKWFSDVAADYETRGLASLTEVQLMVVNNLAAEKGADYDAAFKVLQRLRPSSFYEGPWKK